MPRKFTRSCPKGGTCLVDVIIAELAIGKGSISRRDVLAVKSLKLTPRQASYRLAHLVRNNTLAMTGRGSSARYTIVRHGKPLTHQMKLHPAPFAMIKSGSKTVEMRLNDEKRKTVLPGDTIIFINNEGDEHILAKVEKTIPYESFEELYANHDKLSIGYRPDEDASPCDMLAYYTKEQIARYGVLAILIKVCHD